MSVPVELRVMAEFGANPLWLIRADGSVTNPAATEWVDAGLAARLDGWAARYDAGYDPAYPPDSGFPTADAERAFVEDGRQLAREVARAVAGRGVRVRYATGTGVEDPTGAE